jgi:hypothetical protein
MVCDTACAHLQAAAKRSASRKAGAPAAETPAAEAAGEALKAAAAGEGEGGQGRWRPQEQLKEGDHALRPLPGVRVWGGHAARAGAAGPGSMEADASLRGCGGNHGTTCACVAVSPPHSTRQRRCQRPRGQRQRPRGWQRERQRRSGEAPRVSSQLIRWASHWMHRALATRWRGWLGLDPLSISSRDTSFT